MPSQRRGRPGVRPGDTALHPRPCTPPWALALCGHWLCRAEGEEVARYQGLHRDPQPHAPWGSWSAGRG